MTAPIIKLSLVAMQQCGRVDQSSTTRFLAEDCRIAQFHKAILCHYSIGLSNIQRCFSIYCETVQKMQLLEEYCDAKRELRFSELIIERNLVKLRLPFDLEYTILPRTRADVGTKGELIETVREIFDRMFGGEGSDAPHQGFSAAAEGAPHPSNSGSSSASSSSSSSSQEGHLQVQSASVQRRELLQRRIASIDASIQLLSDMRREIMAELGDGEGAMHQSSSAAAGHAIPPPGGANPDRAPLG
jgi:hypothetical protein